MTKINRYVKKTFTKRKKCYIIYPGDKIHMEKYKIKKAGKDFRFIPEINNKGTREKRIVLDNKENKAIFKYEMYNKNCSEACSEKLSYEIAKVLGYECAHIELALDENNKLGILNYLFVNIHEEEHIDAIAYIKKENEKRSEFYTLENIKKILDTLNTDLFYQFLKIMIFDALIGEQDRHEENWGMIKKNGIYKLSPLYDNGCNLLREFHEKEYAEKYYSGLKDFNSYIRRSKTLIYKNDGSTYKHFELIEDLYKKYPEQIKKEILNLEKLTDLKIENIVNKIPDNIITEKHKEYIIKYIKERKILLLNIIKERRE